MQQSHGLLAIAKLVYTETTKLSPLRPPLWGSGATYDVHLRLIGKLVGDFLLVIIKLFFARCFRFVTIHAFHRRTDRRTDGRTDGQTDRISTAIPCVYASHSRTVKIGIFSNSVCYKVSLCENFQRQSCKAFIGLSVRAQIVGGGCPLLSAILGQTDPRPSQTAISIYFRWYRVSQKT